MTDTSGQSSGTTLDQFTTDVKDAIKSGTQLALEFSDLITIAKDPNAPITTVTVKPDLDLSNVYQLSPVVQVAQLLSLMPSNVLPAGSIVLDTVAVTLLTKTKEIGGVDCHVVFKDGKGASWTIATIGSAPFTVLLSSIDVGITEPQKESRVVHASASGGITISSLDLDVNVAYPDGSVEIQQPSGDMVNVGQFFKQFGLTGVDFLDKLFLDKLEFAGNYSEKSLSIQAELLTKDNQSLTLIPGTGSTAILGLQEMFFTFSHAPGATAASISSQLLSMGALAFDISADRKENASWLFKGDINVPQTWSNLNGGATPPDKPAISVADFADLFVPGSKSQVPSELASFGIASLSADYTYNTGGEADSNAYNFHGEFNGNWQLIPSSSDSLEAILTIDLSRAEDGTEDNKVSAEFDLDGFQFILGYAFGTDNVVSASISTVIDKKKLEIDGDYDLDKKILTLQLASEATFAMLISWFVQQATGNRYFQMPKPWDDILAKLPSISQSTPEAKLTFKIYVADKKVECTYNESVELLGLSFEGISVTYTSSASTGGKSGLQIALVKPELGGKALPVSSWDPATEQPPEVPGQGQSLIEFKLAAAGQHIGFPLDPPKSPPQTVDAAVTAVANALANTSGGLYPAGNLSFSKDIGWLLATHALILGQADLQFIFNDPNLYGVLLEVSKSKGSTPTKLDVLAGLKAEILYRKISETIGVYEGTLTLPDDIRKINFEAFYIQLPSFYLAIYTNGDFKIDVGFPANLDFSNSLQITAAEYSGAGGFYFAKLDGLDPSSLPQVTSDYGVFSPVTEIGLGFRIGLMKGFSSGPLSASLSVFLEGLFEGTFAKFTRFSDSAQDEYYSVKATVAITGHLSGKVDFKIIVASVDVTVFVRADLAITAYRKTVAELSAGVSVRVSVKINLGLFKITIHCSFSMTVKTTATFGSDQTAIWDQSKQSALALQAYALSAGDGMVWQPISVPDADRDKDKLVVYFLPQLTAGDAYPEPDGKQHWYYVGQFGLSNPQGTSDQSSSYVTFVQLALVWGLNAITAQSAESPISLADAEAVQVTREDVQNAIDFLGNAANADQLPSITDIQQLFKNAFSVSITSPEDLAPSNGGTAPPLEAGFFPLIPGMEITLTADSSATKLQSATVTEGHLNAAKTDGSGQEVATSLQAGQQSTKTASSTDPQSFADGVMIDYVLMAVRVAMQQALDTPGLLPETGEVTIKAIKDGLSASALSGIAGQTSRFMLHGTRLPAEGDDNSKLQPLYALTGQQTILDDKAIAAKVLKMTASYTGTASDWGLTFANGGSSLVLASDDKNPVLFAGSGIPATPAVTTTGITTTLMPFVETQPARNYLKLGTDTEATKSSPAADVETIWRLPAGLTALLSDPATDKDGFTLYEIDQSASAQSATGTPVAAGDYAWAMTADFYVTQIPLPGASQPGTPSTIVNTYELKGVDQAGLLRLEKLIGAFDLTKNTGPVAKLSIAYVSGSTSDGSSSTNQLIKLIDVDFTSTFLVQANFSTETTPPTDGLFEAFAATAQPDQAPIAAFVSKLWTGGITNSGGYYLFTSQGGSEPGLPDVLFSNGGTATLALVVELALDSTGSGSTPAYILPDYVNAVRTTGYSASPDGGKVLYTATDKITSQSALLPAGHVGLNITRPEPAEPTGGEYGSTLDQLYNLIAAKIDSIGATAITSSALPALVGPVDDDGAGNDFTYRHIFPLVPTGDTAGQTAPPDSQNPYQYMGEKVVFDLAPVDLYGNRWANLTGLPDLTLGYYDALLSPSQLPYLSFDYLITTSGGTPQLQINFTFTPPDYSGDSGTQQANDLATYAKAYYQLIATTQNYTVTATATCSLSTATALSLDAGTLADNYKAIYALISASGSAVQPAPSLTSLTAALPADGASDLNTDLFFPLTVTLSLERTGPLAANIDATGPARQIEAAVSPHFTAAAADDPRSLSAFEDSFTTTYGTAGFVLAVGSLWREGSSATSSQLWAVRYGAKGINPSFKAGTIDYFAPRPLSNKLISETVSVRGLKDGKLDDTATSEVAKHDADFDAEMRKFLAAIDLQFSPEYAIPTRLVNADAIDSLSASKKATVENLLRFITDLQSGEPYTPSAASTSAIGAAAELYRQQCLISLGNYYTMVSAAVSRLTTQFGEKFDGKPLNAFGNAVAPTTNPSSDSTGKNFSLTSMKGPLTDSADGAPVAVGLFANQPNLATNYQATVEFSFDALEHGIETVSVQGTDYAVGSWLKFVTPLTALSMPALDIPIPLRSFPEPPQLVAQDFTQLVDGTAVTDPNEVLKLAKSWSLNGTYQHQFAAQDTVQLNVKVNLQSGFGLGAFAAEKTLFQALVEFNTLYPQLRAIFASERLTSNTSPETASKASTTLKNALESLAELADTVSTQATWPQVSSSAQLGAYSATAGTLAARESIYEITDGFGVSKPTDQWVSEVKFVSNEQDPISILPELQIAGYTAELLPSEAGSDLGEGSVQYKYEDKSKKGSYLTAETAWTLPTRTAAVMPVEAGDTFGQPLNIIDRQNGLLSMMISRNAGLKLDAFLYETGWVTYNAELSPLIDTSHEIDMAGILAPGDQGKATSPRSIADNLYAFFSLLLQGSDPAEPIAGSFQAVANFDYPVNTGTSSSFDLPQVNLPLTLRLPTPVTLGGQPKPDEAYITEMASHIETWLTTNEMTPTARPNIWPHCAIRFDVSLFSDISQTGQAILRLRNILLSCADIKL